MQGICSSVLRVTRIASACERAFCVGVTVGFASQAFVSGWIIVSGAWTCLSVDSGHRGGDTTRSFQRLASWLYGGIAAGLLGWIITRF